MKKILAYSFIAAVCAINPLATAFGAQNSNTSAQVPDVPQSQSIALTSDECIRLGGEVETDKVCKAGKTCKIESANGDTHSVCLEVTKKTK